MTTVGVLIDEQLSDERRAAVRALLRRPLLRQATDPVAFGHVRRHARWLRTELHALAGYELTVHPSGWARLRKRGLDPLDRRPLRHPPTSRWARRSTAVDRWPELSRRQYVLLALTCAVLCRGHRYMSLRTLVDEVRALADDQRIPLDLYGMDRRPYVGILLWLEEHGGLERRDGSEQALDAWREQDLDADLLWQVNAPLVADLLGAARPLQPTTTVADLFDDTREYVTADDRRNTRGKWRLARRLLEQSVVYVDDLDDDERAWWRTKRSWTEDRCSELTGLQVERRREGTMLIDTTAEPGRALSDLRFPNNRPARDTQLALLLCVELARRLRVYGETVLRAEILTDGERLCSAYAANWRLPEGDRDAALAACEESLSLLVGHGFIVDDGAALRIRPAVCRFAHVRAPDPDAGQGTLL
jgi:uncharacterized protein (TIGR02678 family)